MFSATSSGKEVFVQPQVVLWICVADLEVELPEKLQGIISSRAGLSQAGRCTLIIN